MLENIQIIGKVSLKDLRTLSGLTQEDFAKKVDIPFTTYRRYEHDPSRMDAGRLFQICDIMGIEVSQIKI